MRGKGNISTEYVYIEIINLWHTENISTYIGNNQNPVRILGIVGDRLDARTDTLAAFVLVRLAVAEARQGECYHQNCYPLHHLFWFLIRLFNKSEAVKYLIIIINNSSDNITNKFEFRIRIPL